MHEDSSAFVGPMISRRTFLQGALATASSGLLLTACQSSTRSRQVNRSRLLFTSQGRTAMINADGRGLRYFDFKQPNQVTWQPGPAFPDGHRMLLLSMEARRDGPGKPFEEYYTQTPTHLWIYDLRDESIREIANRERLAVFYTPALLIGDSRLLVQVVRNKVGQIFSMNLDGTDAQQFTKAGEGLPYGLSVSPDGKRVAYHLASPRGYEVWTSNTSGGDRIRVAGHPDHLYFGTSWSPDGRWILFQDCHFKQDPGHDWSDICIGRPEGSGHEVLTRGQSQWFAATYGNPQSRGGGSNMPMWTPDGAILYSRKRPNAKVAWEYQPNRPDTDHFNRDFKPELARGGADICRLNLEDRSEKLLTNESSAIWDFRASASPDGKHIIFCRAETSQPPAVWIMNANGTNQRQLTRGWEDRGADHPRWLA